jgi:hypothetical protein
MTGVGTLQPGPERGPLGAEGHPPSGRCMIEFSGPTQPAFRFLPESQAVPDPDVVRQARREPTVLLIHRP